MKRWSADRKTAEELLFLAFILVGEILFFHNILLNDNLIGYRIDGRLVTFLTEHWYQVFQGKSAWTELACFYPARDVLAYSDMMLLFAFPYSLLRVIGIDMYAALKAVAILFHVLGSITLYLFMRAYVRAPGVAAFLTVVCFSFSNAYNFISGNMQMFSLSLLPVLLIAVAAYIKNYGRKRRYLIAIAGMIWLALLFYTAFYVGYFVCLFAAVSAVVFLVAYPMLRRYEWMKEIGKRLFQHWKEYVLYAVLFILLMLPFVYLYLPALRDFGGRSWEEIAVMFPTWRNLCMLNEKSQELAGFNPEVYNYKTGFPIIDLLVYAVAGIGALVALSQSIRKKGWKKQTGILLLGTVAVLLSAALIVQVNGFTLWYFVYKLLPGASAIRAVLRWLNFISLLLAVFLGIGVTYIKRSRTDLKFQIRVSWCAGILAMVLFCSNYSINGISTGWSVTGEEEFLNSVAVPPEDCKVMYITDRLHTSDAVFQELQMDAWAIALKYNIKTVNGYSGQFPDGWDLLDAGAEDMDQKVCEWLRAWDLTTEGVYSYDIGSNTWEKLSDESE